MEKLRKVSIVTAIFLIIFLGITTTVNAATLTLRTTTDKQEVTVGDTVKVTVNWQEGMQAADFILNYDSSKVEYQSSSIGEDYLTNDSTNGNVKVVWISLNDKDMTNITFTFKAKAEGTVNFSTKIDGGFANGEMVQPDSYDVTTAGKTSVTVKTKGIAQNPENTTPEQEKPTTNTPTQETNKPTTNTTTQGTNKPSKGNTIANTQTKPTEIPHAGSGLNMAIIIAILAGIVVFGYIQNRRYKEI